MSFTKATAATSALCALFGATAASAQQPSQPGASRPVIACSTQQDLEQVIGSAGKLTPDGCRRIQVTRVKSGDRELCVLNLEAGRDQGVLGQLRDVASVNQWWINCSDLERLNTLR